MDAVISETLRYLGIKSADGAALELAAECVDELQGVASFASAWRFYEAAATETRVEIGGVVIESADLARHLRGCTRAAVLTATLGPEPDRLMQRYAVGDIARSAVISAAASALVERCADDAEKRLCADDYVKGLAARTRFSAGYGDFLLEYQREMLLLSDARRIGVGLSGGGMLIPVKSITAVIGFGEQKEPCAKAGCESCSKSDCAYRREPE